MGSIAGSEQTAANLGGVVGQVRRDPMAMLPFCGYNMGDYFQHWIDVGNAAKSRGQEDKLPKIFFVNWFRRDKNGDFMWPGYGENSRALAWIFDRCDGKDNCIDTPIGILPKPGAIEAPKGVSAETMKELTSVDVAGWKAEIADIRKNHYPKFAGHLPKELSDCLDDIEARLAKA
jgi:phosphoenolpyruvate carboxykinase (GTP)